LKDTADIIVVSATPGEALRREWEEHDIAKYVKAIAGQEMGNKSEHLKYAIEAGGYSPDHVLMVGDAPGDLKAAKANNALYYPINPGNEDDSWQRFVEKAFDRFVGGTYMGDYEASLIAEFDKYLPEKPPWKV
jgi:phosphoglycolate phosphatase-like HAD superfamily hydrolase